jgi:hypothetical protein
LGALAGRRKRAPIIDPGCTSRAWAGPDARIAGAMFGFNDPDGIELEFLSFHGG